MPDGSVFYGEIEYINLETKEIIQGYDDLPEDQKKNYKLVRHGYGIQLYGRTEKNNLLIKYAGQWDKDRKHGEGQCTFPDGSEYKGHFKYDEFDGYGRYTWPKVDGKANSYEGYWKEGKMDGGGEFNYSNGQKLKKRVFKNNLFNEKDTPFFQNPLNGKDYNKVQLEKIKNEAIGKEKQAKEEEERVRLFRVKTHQALDRILSQCKVDSRTPLIMSSVESRIGSDDVKSAIQTHIDPQTSIYDIYLREWGIKFREMSREEFLDDRVNHYLLITQVNLNAMLGLCLKSLGIIFLNFDELPDDPNQWYDLFDPDIDNLIGNDCLPPQIWRLNEFAKREVMESCGVIDRIDDENTKIAAFSNLNFQTFQFMLWSKFKLSQDQEDQTLVKKFYERFEKSLPLQNINMIFIESLDDEEK